MDYIGGLLHKQPDLDYSVLRNSYLTSGWIPAAFMCQLWYIKAKQLAVIHLATTSCSRTAFVL